MQSINIPPGPSRSASHSPMDLESSNKERHIKKQTGTDFNCRSVGKASDVHLPDACAHGVVENFVNECNSGKIQNSYSLGERRTTTSEFIASELASYLPVESEVAGFDSKSEDIVKAIVDRIAAENSVDISLPDGWERRVIDPILSQDCRLYGCIVDNNGMPRISYARKKIVLKNPDIPNRKPNQTLEEALLTATHKRPKGYISKRKLRYIMTTHIFTFQNSSAMRSKWQSALQNEKTAREELDKLMGCQVAEFLLEVQSIIYHGRLDYDLVDPLTRGVNSMLDWCNEGNNKETLFQFLKGTYKGTKFVADVAKVVEIFIENNDLPLIISIFKKINSCKSAFKSAESIEEYVYFRWQELHYIGAFEDKITLSCLTSKEEEEEEEEDEDCC